MEVIARKNGSYTGYAILCFGVAVAGLLGCIIGMVSLPQVGFAFLALLLLPGICIPIGCLCIKKAKVPNELIFLDGDKLKIYDGRCFSLSEVKNVTYKHASSKYGTYRFGWITFSLKNGETIKIYPVSEIEEVGKRLSQLVYGQQEK